MRPASPAARRSLRPASLIGAFVFLTVCGATDGWVLAQDASAQRTQSAQNAQKWIMQATPHFEIHYQSSQRGHIDTLTREVERTYARLSAALSHELEAKMPVILVPGEGDLPRDEAEARALVTASGAAERDHLFVSSETIVKGSDKVLAHELTHQFLFELLPQADRDAPWVSEGLPDHYSGIWDSAARATLRDAVTRGRIPAVENLAATDRHWGHAVFDFVATEYGAQTIPRYLAALRDSSATKRDPVRTAFGISSSDFNTSFQRYIKARFADR